MACILKPECNFLHEYFRCFVPMETMEVKVKVNIMRGIHTFRRDQTTPVHILQTLEHKTPSLLIPNKKNEKLPGIGRQTW